MAGKEAGSETTRGRKLINSSCSPEQRGGDFYHYHRFKTAASGERYAFAVGDVSGKGVSAALLMAVSLSQINTILDRPLTPPERLVYLDRAVTPYTKPRRQNCAMCYIELTPPTAAGSSRLQIINAGCIPPYIRRAGSKK